MGSCVGLDVQLKELKTHVFFHISCCHYDLRAFRAAESWADSVDHITAIAPSTSHEAKMHHAYVF